MAGYPTVSNPSTKTRMIFRCLPPRILNIAWCGVACSLWCCCAGEVCEVAWITVHRGVDLFGEQEYILQKVAHRKKAYW